MTADLHQRFIDALGGCTLSVRIERRDDGPVLLINVEGLDQPLAAVSPTDTGMERVLASLASQSPRAADRAARVTQPGLGLPEPSADEEAEAQRMAAERRGK